MEREIRQAELNEYLISMHIYCIIILLYGLILSCKIPNSMGFLSTYNIIIFLFTGLVAVFIISVHSKYWNYKKYGFTWINSAYIAIPTAISFLSIFTIGNKVLYMETTLLLPVIIAASIMGRNIGTFMAFICSVLLILHKAITEHNSSIVEIIEYNLIFICVLFVVGWYIGGLTSIEAKHRKLLKESLLSLEKEISARNIAEEEMRKLTRAVELSPSIIIITDYDGNIEYTNQKFKQITGFSSDDVFNKNIDDLIINFKKEYLHVWDAVRAGEEWSGELYSKKKNGELYWERVSVLPFRNNENIITHFLKVSEDITERKQMEKEIFRFDKLNLVGEMAAGIGHEIRNPMTTVRGFLQLLGSKEECAKYAGYYDLMIEELDRANSIITEYLSLAKNKPVNFSIYNINSIIDTLFPLIQADTLKRNNNVKMEIKDIPDLLLDENEMRQLILNLVRNALEAMPSGGNLTIKTFLEKNNVVLEVQDEGEGIPPEVLEKIGTPFFTTKDDGTGLGLAVCFSIAARHNAKIEVKTSSTGTTFSVRFSSQI